MELKLPRIPTGFCRLHVQFKRGRLRSSTLDPRINASLTGIHWRPCVKEQSESCYDASREG